MNPPNPMKERLDRQKSVPTIEPDAPVDPWREMVESLGKFSEDFMADRNQPEDQERDWLD